MSEPLWVLEKGRDYDVPDEIAKAEGIEDMSWHNDASPSFGIQVTDEVVVRIWVDHPDPDQRECDGGRFIVQAEDWGDGAPVLTAAGIPNGLALADVLSTDDPDEALRAFMATLTIVRRTAR